MPAKKKRLEVISSVLAAMLNEARKQDPYYKKNFVGPDHYLLISEPDQQLFAEFKAVIGLEIDNIYEFLPTQSAIEHLEKEAAQPKGGREATQILLSDADYQVFIKNMTLALLKARSGNGSESSMENALTYDLGL